MRLSPAKRISLLVLWVGLMGALWVYARSADLSFFDALSRGVNALRESPTAPVILLGLYLLRPLVLLPVTILTVATGFLFGATWGFGFALLASLASSSVGYFLGRFFGKGVLGTWALSHPLTVRLREHSFESIITACLIFLPGDLVNYTSGALRVRYPMFVLALAIGSVPGLLIGVLAGASIEGSFRAQGVHINPWYLLASFTLLGLSLAVAYALRRQRRGYLESGTIKQSKTPSRPASSE